MQNSSVARGVFQIQIIHDNNGISFIISISIELIIWTFFNATGSMKMLN